MLRIPPPLKLAIALDRVCMRLPVSFLIIRMGFAPLTPAVADDLGVLGVSCDPAPMVFGAPTTLALRVAADALVQTELRGFERLLTKMAAMARQTAFPPNRFRADPLRKSEYRNSYRVLTASPPVIL